MSDAALESLLKRDRVVVLAALLALTALAWGYLLWLAGNMTMPSSGMSMPEMAMDAVMAAPVAWAPLDLLLAFVMWAVMMVGMMTPSIAPVILLYTRVGRHAESSGRIFAATGWFAAGYFLAWTGFSMLAAAAQMALRASAMLTPDMAAANRTLGAGFLIVAGIYQWSPLKKACLAQCRQPLSFIQRHGGFKRSAAGSLALGFRHGLYCTGCCWSFMLLLFVGGVMNLLWVAALAVLVLMEKLPGRGNFLARATGTALIAGGLLLIYRELFAIG